MGDLGGGLNNSPMPKKDKAPNPRRGKAGKSGDGAAAHVPGAAAAPAFFDPAPIVEEMQVYWKAGAGEQYVMPVRDGRWAVWSQQAMLDKMFKVADGMGLFVSPKRREREVLADSKEVLLYIRENRCLDDVFDALPGYRAGVHELSNGKRVLIKTSPRFIAAEPGEWPIIAQIWEGMLGADATLRQRDYLMAWLKVGAESAVDGEPGNWRPGHALILAGPIGSGKGFIQEHIFTPLLGGRMADPESMLFGMDQYDSDCWSAEHLALGEVPMPSQKMHDRIALSEKIKQIVANPMHRMRVMRTDPLALFPFWRLSISVNDHPDKLRNLPLLTDDFRDKVIILHCAKQPMPMPTRTLEERKAFRMAVAAELPHFLHYLQQWEIPEDMLIYSDGADATRFGFREFHHPIIKEGLFDDTPDAELLGLIDQAEFDRTEWGRPKKLWDLPEGLMNAIADDDRLAGHVWHERATTLQQLLTGEGGCTCSVMHLAKKIFAHNSCARMLGRLAKDEQVSLRVEKADVTAWRGWRIARPPQS